MATDRASLSTTKTNSSRNSTTETLTIMLDLFDAADELVVFVANDIDETDGRLYSLHISVHFLLNAHRFGSFIFSQWLLIVSSYQDHYL